jgi:hypothetical protein
LGWFNHAGPVSHENGYLLKSGPPNKKGESYMLNAKDIMVLVENMNVIRDPKFVKAVEQFVFTNDRKYIAEIAKFKIPANFRSCTSPLFRGMVLSDDIMSSLKDGGSFKINNYSSWSSSEDMAIRFTTDPKKRLKKKKGVRLVCKKKISDSKIILNIQAMFLLLSGMSMLDDLGVDELTAEMGIEEAEVLCDKGIVLKHKDILKMI